MFLSQIPDTTMGLKRKRSDNLLSPVSSTSYNFGLESIPESNFDTFASHGHESYHSRFEVPLNMNSRTMKRYRDNRPSEERIYGTASSARDTNLNDRCTDFAFRKHHPKAVRSSETSPTTITVPISSRVDTRSFRTISAPADPFQATVTTITAFILHHNRALCILGTSTHTSSLQVEPNAQTNQQHQPKSDSAVQRLRSPIGASWRN